jgi:hypothetical protein
MGPRTPVCGLVLYALRSVAPVAQGTRNTTLGTHGAQPDTPGLTHDSSGSQGIPCDSCPSVASPSFVCCSSLAAASPSVSRSHGSSQEFLQQLGLCRLIPRAAGHANPRLPGQQSEDTPRLAVTSSKMAAVGHASQQLQSMEPRRFSRGSADDILPNKAVSLSGLRRCNNCSDRTCAIAHRTAGPRGWFARCRPRV